MDLAMANAIKNMNQKVKVISMKYFDSSYNLKTKRDDADIFMIEFENGQRFELNKQTFKAYFAAYKFKGLT